MRVWVVMSGEECEGFNVEAIYDYPPLTSDMEDKFLWMEFADGRGKFKRADDIKIIIFPMEVSSR